MQGYLVRERLGEIWRELQRESEGEIERDLQRKERERERCGKRER